MFIGCKGSNSGSGSANADAQSDAEARPDARADVPAADLPRLALDAKIDLASDAKVIDAMPADAKPAIDVPPDSPAVQDPVVVLAAGDIGHTPPSGGNQAGTADLAVKLIAEKKVQAVLALGDLAYFNGTLDEYNANYDPFWGKNEIRTRVRPVPGNHDYFGSAEARGYFDYFLGTGQNAGAVGERGKGYYSYDLGAWHFVAMNSSNNPGCTPLDCGEGSAQLAWLRKDLAASARKCTLAYWHHPRFNQGKSYGDAPSVAPLWNALYDAHADVILHGHEHNFQQFSPVNKSGAVDRTAGMRSFIVGTGGAGNFYMDFTTQHQDSLEFKAGDQHGLLELTLGDGFYSWRFVTVSGEVLVSGQDVCR